MKYIKNFNPFRKKDLRIDKEDVETALDVVRWFANENGLSEEIISDDDESKEIVFDSTENTMLTLHGINIRFYSNMRCIFIQDFYRDGYQDPDLKVMSEKMIKRIKLSLRRSKLVFKTNDDYLDLEIRPSKI